MLPNETLVYKNEIISGTQLAKEKVTVATFNTTNRSHNLTLFVIVR